MCSVIIIPNTESPKNSRRSLEMFETFCKLECVNAHLNKLMSFIDVIHHKLLFKKNNKSKSVSSI